MPTFNIDFDIQFEEDDVLKAAKWFAVLIELSQVDRTRISDLRVSRRDY